MENVIQRFMGQFKHKCKPIQDTSTTNQEEENPIDDL